MKILSLLLMVASIARAQGTVQQAVSQLGSTGNWVLSMQWTGDASTGAVAITAATGLSSLQGYVISQVQTIPGATAPTSGYSVQILDAGGADILAGAAASLSATTGQNWAASLSTTPLNGTVRLKITGQAVASAKGNVQVYFIKPGNQSISTLQLQWPLPVAAGGTGTTGASPTALSANGCVIVAPDGLSLKVLTGFTCSGQTITIGTGSTITTDGFGQIYSNRFIGIADGIIYASGGVPTPVAGTGTNCVLVNGTSKAC